VQKHGSEMITVTRWKSATSEHIADQPVEMGCHLGKRQYFIKNQNTKLINVRV